MPSVNQSPTVLLHHASELIQDVLEDRLLDNESLQEAWVERGFVWGQCDTVRAGLVAYQKLKLPVRPKPVDTVEVELAVGRFFEPFEPVGRVGEVQRTIRGENSVVWTVELPAFVGLHDHTP